MSLERDFADDGPLMLRRRLLSVGGPLAGVALAAGSTIGPRLADTVTSDRKVAADVIAAVADQRTASLWGGLFIMVGLALLIPFFAGVTASIRGRGAVLATVGGTIAMVGAVCGALSQWFFFSEFQLTADGVPTAAGVAGLTSLPGLPGILLFLGFVGGLTVGWAVLAVAAWRSGVFARWQVGAFAAAWLALLVSHSVYSAVVIAAAGLVMAPTIAGRTITVAAPVVAPVAA